MTTTPAIAVVIVNFRTAELTIQCLDSLNRTGNALNLRVFVGDAASGDNSFATISNAIAERAYHWATCMDIGCNRGFAFGNNAIIKNYELLNGEYSYIYFLNPDTQVRPGAVSALLEFLEANQKATVAGSKLMDPDGTPRAYAFNFPTPWREFFRGARAGAIERLLPSVRIKIEGLDQNKAVHWVSGASFMVRAETLRNVGLMDDTFFLYLEETDLMKRIRSVGGTVWHVKASHVVHLAGQSTGVRNDTKDTSPVKPPNGVWLESRSYFMRKHYGILGLVTANALYLLGDSVYRVIRLLRGLPIETPPGLWNIYAMGKRPRNG